MIDIEPLRDIVRARFGRITAFQLGMAAAEHLCGAADGANPYAQDTRANAHYKEGVCAYNSRAGQNKKVMK